MRRATGPRCRAGRTDDDDHLARCAVGPRRRSRRAAVASGRWAPRLTCAPGEPVLRAPAEAVSTIPDDPVRPTSSPEVDHGGAADRAPKGRATPAAFAGADDGCVPTVPASASSSPAARLAPSAGVVASDGRLGDQPVVTALVVSSTRMTRSAPGGSGAPVAISAAVPGDIQRIARMPGARTGAPTICHGAAPPA